MDKRELINENLVDILPLAATFILGVAAGPAIKDIASKRIQRAIEKYRGKDYKFVSDNLDTNVNSQIIQAHKAMYQQIANKLYNNKDIMSSIKRLQTGKNTQFDPGFIQGIVEEFNDLLDDSEKQYLLALADPNAVLQTMKSKNLQPSFSDNDSERSRLIKMMGFDERNLKHYEEKSRSSKYDPNRDVWIDKILKMLNMHPIDKELTMFLQSQDNSTLQMHFSASYSGHDEQLINYIKDINHIWRDRNIKEMNEMFRMFNEPMLFESLESAQQYVKLHGISKDIFDFFNAFDTTAKKKLIHQMLIWYVANPKIYNTLQKPENNRMFTSLMQIYCTIDKSGRIKIPDNDTYAMLKTHGFTIKVDPAFKPTKDELDSEGNVVGRKGKFGVLPQIEQFKTIEPFIERISPLMKVQSNSQIDKKAKDTSIVLADNDRYMIIRPTTDAAFCKYGKNTKWCVSDKVGKFRRAYLHVAGIELFFVLSKIYKNEGDRYNRMCVAIYPPNHGYAAAHLAAGVPKTKYPEIHWFDSKNNEGIPNLQTAFPLPDNIVDDFIEKHGITESDLKKMYHEGFKYEFTLEDAIKICADGRPDDADSQPGIVTIAHDGTYNIEGDIYLSQIKEPFKSQISKDGKLPVKFGKVTGNFIASQLGLTTLENSPDTVGETFDVSYNKLTSLRGGPKSVGGEYNVAGNSSLKSKEGAPAGVSLETYETQIKEGIEPIEEVNTKLTIKPNQNNILYDKKTISIIASENENNPELTKNTNWKIIPNELYFVIEDSAKFPSDAYHKLLFYPSARIKKLYNAASQEVDFSNANVQELFRKMEMPWNNPTYIQNVKY